MTGKSIWAVAAGVIAVVVVTTIIDVVLHLTHVLPPMNERITDMQALLATSYRIVLGVAGGWLTASLAPASPMKHAMWLGYLGTLVGIVGLVATWNLDLGPRWYPVVIAVLAIPQAWLGGRLHGNRVR